MKDKNLNGKQAAVSAGIAIGLVLVVAFAANGNMFYNVETPPQNIISDFTESIQKTIDEPEWHLTETLVPRDGKLVSLAEADPGVGDSGFCAIYLINKSASAPSGYGHNGSGYYVAAAAANMAQHNSTAMADAFNVEIESQKTFVVIVKGAFDDSVCKNATMFKDNRVRINITMTCTNWADGNDETDTGGTIVVTDNDTSNGKLWVNAYWDADDNNGYQLDDGATLTISKIEFFAKY